MSDNHYWVVIRDADEYTETELRTTLRERLHVDPDDVSVADMDDIRRAVWAWVETQRAGIFLNPDVIASTLEFLGFPCPDDMREN